MGYDGNIPKDTLCILGRSEYRNQGNFFFAKRERFALYLRGRTIDWVVWLCPPTTEEQHLVAIYMMK